VRRHVRQRSRIATIKRNSRSPARCSRGKRCVDSLICSRVHVDRMLLLSRPRPSLSGTCMQRLVRPFFNFSHNGQLYSRWSVWPRTCSASIMKRGLSIVRLKEEVELCFTSRYERWSSPQASVGSAPRSRSRQTMPVRYSLHSLQTV
jgi:hypothetical protein